ncbi:MAG: AMP-binding protein [Betaproteobacteria bacterium]
MIQTLPALSREHLAARPGATAFIVGERRVSHAAFDAMGRSAAAWLHAQGVGPGDRVAVWLVNRMEWLALLFGLARLGASLVAVNTRFRSAELEHILRKSRAKMLVIQRGLRLIDFTAVLEGASAEAAQALEKVAVLDAGRDLPARVLDRPAVAFDALERDYPDAPDCATEDAVLAMFTTSGTTKGPKLVMHTQKTVSLHARRCAESYGFDRHGACLLGGLPFCGVFGFSSTLGAYAGGAPVVMMETYDGAKAAALMTAHRVTHMFGGDELYRRLLEAAPGPRPFPDARLFGFAALAPGGNAVALEGVARGLPMAGLYGSSEVHALFSVQPEGLPPEKRIEGGGAAASTDAMVRIRDVATGELAAPGVSGDLEIRSPTNFTGYFDDPATTAEAIGADGFFRTGDIGKLLADGRFIYETRKGDAIRLAGFLVDPMEIEDAIKRDPAVAGAQVVAVDIGGEQRPVAFVIPAPGAAPTEAGIVAGLRGVIAAFKVPARVWLVDAFPTTPSANGTKIQRGALRARAQSLLL